MAYELTFLDVPKDRNFIRLCNDRTYNNVLIAKIKVPEGAINGFQLNVLLGPNITADGSIVLTNNFAIAFNFRTSLTFKQYRNTDVAASCLGESNIIFPEYAPSDPTTNLFNTYGMANVAWDPNNKLGTPGDSLYPVANPGDILFKPKLLQFVLVENYYPLRRITGEGYFSTEVGKFWLLQNIQTFGTIFDF
jgi:hypothetical protein